MMEDWKTMARAEVHKVRRTIATRLNFHGKNKPCDIGPFQTSQTQHTTPVWNLNPPSRIVSMDVDSATTSQCTLCKKLMDKEREQYCKEGQCFSCCQKGHMACECSGRSPSLALVHSMNNLTMAIETTPNSSASNVPTACVTTIMPKLTRAQQITKLEEEMCQEAALTRCTSWRCSRGGVGLGLSGKQLHPATQELTAWQEGPADSSQ